MVKFVYFFAVFSIFIVSGYALTCYKCDAETMDGCTKHANPTKQPCGNSPAGEKGVCYYRVVFDTNKKVYSSKSSCVQIDEKAKVDKSSVEDCAEKDGMQIKECRVCDTELCNSSPSLSTSLITFVCLPVMYFFTKFVLH